ncbi:MAG: hypothetical protein PHT99_01490 [Methanoregula sp.]|nr:hypothetical protein [Methanoregula sp.]
MPETTQPAANDSMKSNNEKRSTTLHTCACGEQHEELPGSPSHRDECTSPRKFGTTCCCGSGQGSNTHPNPCGHGPKCK